MIPLFLLVIYLTYGSISVVLYVRIIWLLWSDFAFKGVIYQIMLVLGVVDILNYLLNLFLFRFSQCPNFVPYFAQIRPNRWLGILFFVMLYASYVQYLLQFVITLNRFTAVVFSQKYNKLWIRLYPIAMAISLTLPIPLVTHHLFSTKTYFPLAKKDIYQGLLPSTVSYDYHNINDVKLLSIVTFTFAGVCLSLNVFSVAWLWHLKAQQKKNGAKGGYLNNIRPELHLLLICVVMVVCQCLSGSILVLNDAIQNDTFRSFLYAQLPWISDLNNFNAAWLLFLVNSKLRAAVFGRATKVTPYFIQFVSNSREFKGIAKKSNLLTAPARVMSVGRLPSAADLGV
ncbi:srg family chemoreceptor domain-containing protein [Ditylenchus destructor]|uniref:Serpentine receptor class gamma n=1 Tax=Ditylenchus destructor TaxID=166010 RepID=A0AAD4QSK0_9BILA|nr:srg family chemoreceptor domain-containing protein [Ditylenchus destructor]